MYCARCDRWEDDQIALECEICLRCGGPLVEPDGDLSEAVLREVLERIARAALSQETGKP